MTSKRSLFNALNHQVLDLTLLAVEHLTEKHRIAEKRFADADAYLTSMEQSIDDENLVATWRKEHDEWETKVVEVKNHGHMDNPFEIASDAGMFPLIL